MKATWKVMIAAAGSMLAFSACGGTSPSVLVVCTASQQPGIKGAGSAVFKIVQAVSYTDPGAPGSQVNPLSNVDIRIVSPFPDNAAVCPGNCTAAGTFKDDTKVKTDSNGILIFTVKLTSAGAQDISGSLIEVADSQASSSCSVDFAITA